MIFQSKNLEDTERFAIDLVKKIKEKVEVKKIATLVCLSGNLGSGKTTLTQLIAKILGVKETVTSPTFVIEKVYKLKDSVFRRLIHIDAYRLKSGEELTQLGWEEIIGDPKNLIFLEWPENVKEILPDNQLKVSLRVVNENEREIKIIE